MTTLPWNECSRAGCIVSRQAKCTKNVELPMTSPDGMWLLTFGLTTSLTPQICFDLQSWFVSARLATCLNCMPITKRQNTRKCSNLSVFTTGIASEPLKSLVWKQALCVTLQSHHGKHWTKHAISGTIGRESQRTIEGVRRRHFANKTVDRWVHERGVLFGKMRLLISGEGWRILSWLS